ncbi:MAG: class I SAM-dependent methyltransferase [Chitinophagaceae bacterium]|nr:class I SAM-dependent methyltransferase [Chitinophagaceae bacterium]
MYHLVTEVMNDKTDYPEFTEIEKLRLRLLADKRHITVEDFGAGSLRLSLNSRRRICDIARTALKPRRQAQLLYRLVKFFKPGHMIELGTSFGITTCYLSLANPESKLYTLEGAAEVLEIAKEHFQLLGISNITAIPGRFDETLPSLLDNCEKVDFAFLDGNHRKEPTLKYFTMLAKKSTDETIIVTDDIYWSAEMTEAWYHIQHHPLVTGTLDFFHFGIVFFRKDFLAPCHVKVRL